MGWNDAEALARNGEFLIPFWGPRETTTFWGLLVQGLGFKV